jgi:putative DNA primase/helicase
LLDRTLGLDLPIIQVRLTEKELNARLDLARPRILGALLDAVAVALRELDAVELIDPPRMADFAHWIVASESDLVRQLKWWEDGHFIRVYRDNRSGANQAALDASSICAAH